ncbi:hypothetical protein TTRE_0000414801 [Trichuris trichiura]|uniref:Uncharacterized protein n=1 Tax=Trichuris trichiura TaxID=36087 RepID=A0A077Z7X8_TRITR|nr:hypothetical protein TTRE_0000414801 [Trichuris trichiura]
MPFIPPINPPDLSGPPGHRSHHGPPGLFIPPSRHDCPDQPGPPVQPSQPGPPGHHGRHNHPPIPRPHQRQKHGLNKGDPSVTLKGVPGPHDDHGPQLPLKSLHTSWHYPHHSSPPTGFEAAAASKFLHERCPWIIYCAYLIVMLYMQCK